MSELTANTIIPLTSALPDNEKRELLEKLEASISTTKRNKRQNKSCKHKGVPRKFWRENKQMLAHELLHGKSS